MGIYKRFILCLNSFVCEKSTPYLVFLSPSSVPDMRSPVWGLTHWPTSNPTLAKVAQAQTPTNQRKR